MPAWMTPLLAPVWPVAGSGARSSTTASRSGRRRLSSRATARPTIPPPTTARSHSAGGAAAGISAGPMPRVSAPGEVEICIDHPTDHLRKACARPRRTGSSWETRNPQPRPSGRINVGERRGRRGAVWAAGLAGPKEDNMTRRCGPCRVPGLLVLAFGALALPASAQATFPGRNGEIVYAWMGAGLYRGAPAPTSIRAGDPRSGTVRFLRDCPLTAEFPGHPTCGLSAPRYSPDGVRIALLTSGTSPDLATMAA